MAQRKLTSMKVTQIRRLYQNNEMTIPKIASTYKVTSSLIYQIIYGDIWAKAGGPILDKKTKKYLYKEYQEAPEAPEASINGDLTTLRISEASHVLQALSHEWPKIKASFIELDRIISIYQHSNE